MAELLEVGHLAGLRGARRPALEVAPEMEQRRMTFRALEPVRAEAHAAQAAERAGHGRVQRGWLLEHLPVPPAPKKKPEGKGGGADAVPKKKKVKEKKKGKGNGQDGALFCQASAEMVRRPHIDCHARLSTRGARHKFSAGTLCAVEA